MKAVRMHLKTALAAIALLSGGGALFAQERPPLDPAQVERRIGSVETLIERSSVARQIESSADAGALTRRDQARKLHAQAVAAFSAGDVERANGLLDQASRQLFEGARMAAPEPIMQEKARRDFAARMESTRTLIDALKRINSEKSAGRDGEQLVGNVERGVRESERLAATGDITAARAALDQSYLVAKAAIGGLRGGDTLVRSLSFASKDEEYRYEVDRNETHRMLIKLLVEEKRAASAGSVASFLERAATLRARADEHGARREYDEAIRLLEESTREFVRAIRSAGIYIPG